MGFQLLKTPLKALKKAVKDTGKQIVRSARDVGKVADSNVAKAITGVALAATGVGAVASATILAVQSGGGRALQGKRLDTIAKGTAQGAAAGVAANVAGKIARAGFNVIKKATGPRAEVPDSDTIHPPVEPPAIVEPPVTESIFKAADATENPAAYELAGKVWAPGTREHGRRKWTATVEKPATTLPVVEPSRITNPLRLFPRREEKRMGLNTNRDKEAIPVIERVAVDANPTQLSAEGGKNWMPLILLALVVVAFVFLAKKKG